MSTVRIVLELTFIVATTALWIRDWRKDAPSARAWAVANGMRKLSERAADVRPTQGEPCGYRDAALPEVVENRPGVLARMRARRRAKQMLAMERRAER